jgi:hypothetical protein
MLTEQLVGDFRDVLALEFAPANLIADGWRLPLPSAMVGGGA